MLKFINQHKDKVAAVITHWQNKFSVLCTYSELLSESIMVNESVITAVPMVEKPIIMGEENDYSASVGFIEEFARFCESPHRPALDVSFPIGGYFESMDRFAKAPALPTRFFSIDPNGREHTEAGLYLTGYTLQ
jgi:hypothetical protein